MSELIFNNSEMECFEGALEVDVHEMDVDTSIEYIINQTDSRKRRVKAMLNKQTWHALKKEDQLAWDTLSQEGKEMNVNFKCTIEMFYLAVVEYEFTHVDVAREPRVLRGHVASIENSRLFVKCHHVL